MARSQKRSSSPSVDPAWGPVLETLARLGFLRAVPPGRRDACKAAILERAYLFDECTGRTFFCDAENVAEAGAAEWLNEARPSLGRLGLSPLNATDVQVEPDYVISVNGVRHVIVSESEIQSTYLWAFAQARLMAVLDEAFAAAGSDERAYALYAGNNDSVLVVLTPDMYDLIKTFAGRAKHELPTSTADLLAAIRARA